MGPENVSVKPGDRRTTCCDPTSVKLQDGPVDRGGGEMNGCLGRGGRRRGSDCLAGWGFLSDENALETEEVRCDAQSVSSASEWDTWKCFTWCSFLSGEYSNKEGRAVNGLEWGLSRGRTAPSFNPLASVPESGSVPSHLAFVRPLALRLNGDLSQVDLTCEEPPGDRAPRGAAWSPRF